ncbi:hypothetical protein [Geobacter sp. OR-1]|uniref:hypothetical protein n=1 Tax=Geobacter sp. OR-1 TaxID=1266765 RepID=UPI00126A538D|nr:hypothetical protein [Geobacter sp. OR-1]
MFYLLSKLVHQFNAFPAMRSPAPVFCHSDLPATGNRRTTAKLMQFIAGVVGCLQVSISVAASKSTCAFYSVGITLVARRADRYGEPTFATVVPQIKRYFPG